MRDFRLQPQSRRDLHFHFVCFFLVRQPPEGQGLMIHEVSRSHTTTHHSQQDSSGQVISLSQRPLPDNKHNTHNRQTSMPPVGFEHIISADDLRLWRRGHWDRLHFHLLYWNHQLTLPIFLKILHNAVVDCGETKRQTNGEANGQIFVTFRCEYPKNEIVKFLYINLSLLSYTVQYIRKRRDSQSLFVVVYARLCATRITLRIT